MEPQNRFTQTLWTAEYDAGKASTRFEISFFIEALYLSLKPNELNVALRSRRAQQGQHAPLSRLPGFDPRRLALTR